MASRKVVQKPAKQKHPQACPVPNPQTFSLAGKTALVTGSSTGLGQAIAFALGAAGAKVALNYSNNSDRAQRCLEAFRAKGYVGDMFRASVISEAEVNAMVKDIEKKLGPVDILLLNATPDQPHKPIEQYDWAFYQQMLDFFIKSPFLLTRAVLPHMKKKRYGRIINVGSEVVQRGVGNFSAYVAAKGGQNGWTRSMSSELIPFGITVNMISPGWIPVDRHVKDPQAEKDAYFSLIPAGRWGIPDDVGGICAFLAGEAAAFISGQNIAVNGGMTVA